MLFWSEFRYYIPHKLQLFGDWLPCKHRFNCCHRSGSWWQVLGFVWLIKLDFTVKFLNLCTSLKYIPFALWTIGRPTGRNLLNSFFFSFINFLCLIFMQQMRACDWQDVSNRKLRPMRLPMAATQYHYNKSRSQI